MMSGLPPASPHDTIPNWITYTVSWPPTLKNCLDYQWNEVAIPYWQGLVEQASNQLFKRLLRGTESCLCI